MPSPFPPLRHRIGRRLAGWVGLSSLLLGGGLAAVLVPWERTAVEQSAADQVGLLAEAVAASFEVVDERNRRHPTSDVVAQVARAPNAAFVEVLDHSGTVVTSTRPGRIGAQEPMHGALRRAEIGGELITVSQNMPWTQSCVGCHEGGHDPVGTIRVAVDRREAVSRLERFHVATGLSFILIFSVIVALLLWLTDRLVSRRVFALAHIMQRAEEGDFLVRAQEDRTDEVGALAAAFNRMLAAITAMKASEIEREADLESARQELSYKQRIEEIAEALQASNTSLERRVRAQQLLMEAAHRLGSTLDRSELFDRCVALIHDTLGYEDFALFSVFTDIDEEPALRIERALGQLHTEPMQHAKFQNGRGIVGLVAETGVAFRIDDLAAESERARLLDSPLPFRSGTMALIPMLHKARVIGVMAFWNADFHTFDDDSMELLQALGAQVAMAVVNADLYEATRELSVTDPLTRLMNRRGLQRRMEIELVRAQRFQLPLAVLMIDVDHFKQYNDRMGHLLGDEALQAVAATLEAQVRKVDAVGRFGGEEFCVVLPRTDEKAAQDVAEKLRKSINRLAVRGVEDQPLGQLSISVGIAMYPAHMPPALEGSGLEVLLDVADKAVYEAKALGRNRVVTASDALKLGEKPRLDTRRASADPGILQGESVRDRSPS